MQLPIASPISDVDTVFSPALAISAVLNPFFKTALTAFSMQSAASGKSKE